VDEMGECGATQDGLARPLVNGRGTLRHILTGCKVALSQGRFTWRHDQVLQCLALALEGKCNMTNKLPPVLAKHYINVLGMGYRHDEIIY